MPLPIIALALAVQAAPAVPPERCVATPPAAAADLLARAGRALGADALADSVLHYTATVGTKLNDQSDRGYPPYLMAFTEREAWVDAARGVERVRGARGDVVTGPRATFVVRDGAPAPAEQLHGRLWPERLLDPWMVVADWSRAADAHVVARCRYRDRDRVVIQRPGPDGAERLYLDATSMLPVKVDRVEPQYYWGQVHAEYVYATWWAVGSALYPVSATRVVDGFPLEYRTVYPGQAHLVPRDSAPDLTLPHGPAMSAALPPRFDAPPPDTVRIGPTAFLLVNRAFTSAVALVRDTVFVLDATQGETRARQDSAWVGRLFPGRHAIVLVVVNLAWPHTAGMRFWLASGARVVAHEANLAYVRSVAARRWTLRPDALEAHRGRERSFIGVQDSLALAGGGVRIYAMNEPDGETSVMAYLAGDRFLWASDHIQSVTEPNEYVAEVWRAARRLGLSPNATSGPHLEVVPWSTVTALVGTP